MTDGPLLERRIAALKERVAELEAAAIPNDNSPFAEECRKNELLRAALTHLAHCPDGYPAGWVREIAQAALDGKFERVE